MIEPEKGKKEKEEKNRQKNEQEFPMARVADSGLASGLMNISSFFFKKKKHAQGLVQAGKA